jgi:hypothetical protein
MLSTASSSSDLASTCSSGSSSCDLLRISNPARAAWVLTEWCAALRPCAGTLCRRMLCAGWQPLRRQPRPAEDELGETDQTVADRQGRSGSNALLEDLGIVLSLCIVGPAWVGCELARQFAGERTPRTRSAWLSGGGS